MDTVVVIAKCRECDRRARLVLSPVDGCVPVTYADGSTRLVSVADAVPFLVWCAGSYIAHAGVYRDGTPKTYVNGETTCRVPHGPMRGNALKARRTDKPCDARCMRSGSGECHCSCGGSNHGIYA